jgi:putative ATP-dependent endonuclease of the OLD family
MYLKEVQIWNFRKYGSREEGKPGVVVKFQKHFNLLIGENDSGKTTIIDALKLTLGTSSADNHKIQENDFHINDDGTPSSEIKIECIFTDLSEKEAGLLLEWLTFDNEGNYELRVRLTAKKVKNEFGKERIEKNIKAGPEFIDSRLEGIALELIGTTYLKPLRDAENELRPGFKSRLAQILKNHIAFKKVDESEKHRLEEVFEEANKEIEAFFDAPYDGEKTIKKDLNSYLDNFFHISKTGEKVYNPDFQVSKARLSDILRKLSLILDDNPTGLGSLNLLFIATELLLQNEGENVGPNLTLIEEIEAHLHPQAQLRLIKYLQELENVEGNTSQFILTTHSTTLAASTKLNHINLINNKNSFPMGPSFTKLAQDDYKFLERFLDATKANLFFARGVIFVEGDAENILLPAVAEIINRPLHKYGVSIVNIGNTAFKRYSKIYSRSSSWLENNPPLNVPVSIITDVDVRPFIYYRDKYKSKDKQMNKEVVTVDSEAKRIAFSDILGINKQEVDIIQDIVFTTKKDLKETIELYYGKINHEKLDLIVEQLKTDLTEEMIKRIRERKVINIKERYKDPDSNIEVFVAPNWTLEYEIALSGIRTNLISATHKTKFINQITAVNGQKITQTIKEIEEITDEEERAYTIYKPLLNNNVSKATTAQVLAEELLSLDRANVSEIIMKDTYLNYLKQAVYHVTEGEN